jgi:hypothetical protein
MITMKTTPRNLNNIQSVLTASPFKPFRYISKGIESEINHFWFNRITDSLKSDKSQLIEINSGDRLEGFILINDLPWDSRILKTNMACISEFVLNPNCNSKELVAGEVLEKAIAVAKNDGYQFLLCKVYTNDLVAIHALEKAGFLLVDTLLEYEVDFRKTPFNDIHEQNPSEDIIIRFAKMKDELEISELAKAAFANHFGRYHSDPRIPRNLATQVYAEWMHSSLRGYADHFVIADVAGKIAGLSIWKKTSDLEKTLPVRISHYSIGAILPDYFGKKLFSILSFEGMKLLNKESDIIEVSTHINNYPVQRALTRLGWQIGDARHSFHKWLD